MAFQPVAGTYGVRLRGTLYEQEWQNTIYVVSDPNATGATDTVEAATESVGNSWADNILPELSQDCKLTEAYGVDLSTQDGAVFTWTPTTGQTEGGRNTEALPGNVTLYVQFKGARRNRRGGNYVAGIPADQRTGNTVSQAWVDLLIAGYDAFYAQLFGGNWVHVLVKRRDGGVELPAGLTEFVNNYVANRNLDSQRRRLNGRGV